MKPQVWYFPIRGEGRNVCAAAEVAPAAGPPPPPCGHLPARLPATHAHSFHPSALSPATPVHSSVSACLPARASDSLCLPLSACLPACLSLPACLPAGRAEPVKLALAAKGIDFEVCDVDYAEMKADNVKYPFHQCPRCAAAGSRATASQHACIPPSPQHASPLRFQLSTLP